MRRAAVAAALLLSTAAVATAGDTRYIPSPLLPLDGLYRMPGAGAVSLAVTPDGGLLYTDLGTGDLRQLQPQGPGRFTFGPAYLYSSPVRGTIAVKGHRLTLTTGGHARTGTRLPVRRTRVAFTGAGIRLVGKVTSPATPGRHPAIAVVHGSDAMDRDGTDLFVNFFTSLGYVVLSYDKRGVGDSGGAYQEYPSPQNVDNLARDAVGAVRTLAARADVDSKRIGLFGGSQAGWIIPHAAGLSPLVSFAVITAGPTMSVGEQGLYAGITSNGLAEPPPTEAAIRKQLQGAQPSGFDPRPDLARLSIPTLWLFGREDKTVYTPQSVEILQGLPTPPTIKVFPGAGHFILDTPHGLTNEIPKAHRFASGLFSTIAGWLKSH